MGRVRSVARVAVLAAAGTTLALAGGPGTAGAQDDKQQVDTEITYQCDTGQVVLHVTASFPTGGTVGEPVQPTGVTLAATVAPETLAQLTGAATATAVVRLNTNITQGETATSAEWAVVRDTPIPVTPEAGTVFTGTVEPEPVTAGGPGELTFTADGLSVTVSGQNVDGVPTEPPSVTLTCVPAADQTAALATVPVAGADEDPTKPAPKTEAPAPGLKVGTEAAPLAAAAGAVPPECHAIPPPPNTFNPQNYCASLAGYANVAKLNASILQPAGIININAGSFKPKCDNVTGKFCSENAVIPNNPTESEPDGEFKLPVASGSFFSFGLIPTRGKMQLTQLDAANVHIWFKGRDGLATATLQLSVQLIKAKICLGAGEEPQEPGDCGGEPIELGPNCRTATAVDVVLTAKPGTYSITEGGVLDGTVTIPPFSGCGVTEDLDPLITRLVAGPNNYVKMTQGKVCSLTNGVVCPPPVPVPQR